MAAGAITAILASIPPMALVSGIPTNTTLPTAALTGPPASVNSNSQRAVQLRQPRQVPPRRRPSRPPLLLLLRLHPRLRLLLRSHLHLRRPRRPRRQRRAASTRSLR